MTEKKAQKILQEQSTLKSQEKALFPSKAPDTYTVTLCNTTTLEIRPSTRDISMSLLSNSSKYFRKSIQIQVNEKSVVGKGPSARSATGVENDGRCSATIEKGLRTLL